MRNMIIFAFLVMALPISGCGKFDSVKGDVNERSFPIKADNPQIREFNRRLGEIKDQESAEKAVTTFVDYVDSRVTGTTDISGQAIDGPIRGELIRNIARREVMARNRTVGIMSATEVQEPTPLIDLGTVTDNINELSSSEGLRVDDETVLSAKSAVEQSLPNMNPENRGEMTPLETMVLGYAVVSGDNGNATQESLALPAEKMNTYVETMTN